MASSTRRRAAPMPFTATLERERVVRAPDLVGPAAARAEADQRRQRRSRSSRHGTSRRSTSSAKTTVEALRGVTMSVQPGEFVALMGPSGSGKSTLLQLLGGLDRPTTGAVVFEGRDISGLSDAQATRLRRERTGYVFQAFNLIPLLDVRENIALPFTIGGAPKDWKERVRQVIDLVELTGKERHRPDQLSAGEQQRVAVARALVTRPSVLLADEPTGNLDYTNSGELLDALWRSCEHGGQTIVLVTHDARAAAYADRVLVIGDGHIQEEISLGRRADHSAARADRAAGPGRPVARWASTGLAWRAVARASAPLAPHDPRHRARHRRPVGVADARRGARRGRRPDRPRHGRPRRPARVRLPRDRACRPPRVATITSADGVVDAAPVIEHRTFPSGAPGGRRRRRGDRPRHRPRLATTASTTCRSLAGTRLDGRDEPVALITEQLAADDGYVARQQARPARRGRPHRAARRRDPARLRAAGRHRPDRRHPDRRRPHHVRARRRDAGGPGPRRRRLDDRHRRARDADDRAIRPRLAGRHRPQPARLLGRLPGAPPPWSPRSSCSSARS